MPPNLPDILEDGQSEVQIAWPRAVLRDQKGRFLGFAMPLLDLQRSIELEYILQERQARAQGLSAELGAKMSLFLPQRGAVEHAEIRARTEHLSLAADERFLDTYVEEMTFPAE